MTRAEPSPTLATSGEFFPWVVLAFGSVATCTWAGAALASVANRTPARPNLEGAGAALVRLPSHVSDPANAWPPPFAGQLPGPWLYWFCQLLVLTALVACVAVVLRARGGRRGRRTSLGVNGETGLARTRDLGRLTVAAPQQGRITVGRCGRRLLACEPQASLAVVGPTGCGKTAGFAIPAILEWSGPVLALSVKSDLLEATEMHRRGRGAVWVYDPTGAATTRGDAWSPLASCRTWGSAMRVAAWMTEAAQPRFDTVSDGDYWYSQARKALAPYLHAAAVDGRSVADLVHWIDTQEQREVEHALRRAVSMGEGTSRWQELFDASVVVARDLLKAEGEAGADLAEQPFDQWPRWLADQVREAVDVEWRLEVTDRSDGISTLAALTAVQALWGKEQRLRGSVFATVENVLSSWADPGVSAAAGASSIDLDQWLSGDNTLYVVATAHEQARLRPVLTVLVQQAIRHAYDTAARNGGRLSRPCLLLLDEAGNTSPLRDLPGYASTARSHGITLVTVWQDLAQIKALYHDRAQTVLNNHRAKLFGSGIADASTLEYVSRLIGDEHRTERNVSVDLAGGRRSINEHHSYRRAAPMDVLRRVPPGEGVLLYGSELPAHVRLRTWFTDRTLRATADRPDLVSPHERRRDARLRR